MPLPADGLEEDFLNVYLVGMSCVPWSMMILGGDNIAAELMEHTFISS